MQLNQDPNKIDSNNNTESQENNDSELKNTKNTTLKKLWFILWLSVAWAWYTWYQAYQAEKELEETIKQTKEIEKKNWLMLVLAKKRNDSESKREIEEDTKYQESIKEWLHENGDYVIDFSKQIPEMNLYNNSLQIHSSNVSYDFIWDNHIAFHVNNYKNIDLEISVSYTDENWNYHIKDLSFNDIETLNKLNIVSEELSEINTTNTPWEWSITLDNEISLTRNSNTGSNEYFIEAYYTRTNTEEIIETGYISTRVDMDNKNIIHLQWQTPENEFIKINIKLKDKFWKIYNLEWLDNIFYLETKEKTED
jgi:cell fate (sporulation/competence/biofilm development) regulator YlbF (YheA/YmcA/DUF963 family)